VASQLDSPLAPHRSTPTELQERALATRSGHPFVVLRHPDNGQIIISLAGRDRLTVGRRTECDLALTWDDRVSRLHTELVRIGGEWIVTDDGLSANGTWVGDVRLTGQRRLRDGDLVRVGMTLLAFCASDESAGTTVHTGHDSARVTITPAQRRVLVALCRPLVLRGSMSPPSNAEVAAELFLSTDAVKTHLKALFEAFELHDVPPRQKRTELVGRAVRSGTVQIRDFAES
jgi:pSer/pThr/pTyr-binding forkhead associated (FHA) protein